MDFWAAITIISGGGFVTAMIVKFMELRQSKAKDPGIEHLTERVRRLEEQLELSNALTDENRKEIETLQSETEFYKKLLPDSDN